MNTSSLVNQINESLATLGAGPFRTTGTVEADDHATVTGDLGGRTLRIEFVEKGSGDHAENGHVVEVLDDETGTSLGTGTGDSTFADAISSFAWAGMLEALADLG